MSRHPPTSQSYHSYSWNFLRKRKLGTQWKLDPLLLMTGKQLRVFSNQISLSIPTNQHVLCTATYSRVQRQYNNVQFQMSCQTSLIIIWQFFMYIEIKLISVRNLQPIFLLLYASVDAFWLSYCSQALSSYHNSNLENYFTAAVLVTMQLVIAQPS